MPLLPRGHFCINLHQGLRISQQPVKGQTRSLPWKPSSHLHYISGLGAFLPLDDFKFHLVAFLKALVTFAGDCAVMHKNIGTIFTSDKPKSFSVVEPLHSSLETSHLLFLRASCFRRRNRRSQPAQTMRSSGLAIALLNFTGLSRCRPDSEDYPPSFSGLSIWTLFQYKMSLKGVSDSNTR